MTTWTGVLLSLILWFLQSSFQFRVLVSVSCPPAPEVIPAGMPLCRTGGFFFERWGDAPVHSLAAAMFLNSTEVRLTQGLGSELCPYSSAYVHFPLARKPLPCSGFKPEAHDVKILLSTVTTWHSFSKNSFFNFLFPKS